MCSRVLQKKSLVSVKYSSVGYIIDCSSYFLELSLFKLTFIQFNGLLSKREDVY